MLHQSPPSRLTPPAVQHIAKSLGLGITCFTLNRKYGLVAFSERGEGYHPHIRVCRLPEFGGPNFPLPVDGPLTNYEEKYGKEGRSRNRGSWRLR